MSRCGVRSGNRCIAMEANLTKKHYEKPTLKKSRVTLQSVTALKVITGPINGSN